MVIGAVQWFRVRLSWLFQSNVILCSGTPARTATYPITHAASESLGAWQARIPHATLPAL